MVQLLQKSGQLSAFETFHMQGHWDADGTQFTAAIRRVVGHPRIKVGALPWE